MSWSRQPITLCAQVVLGFGLCTSVVLGADEDGLIAYWPFDEAAGSASSTDVSGHGHDAELLQGADFTSGKRGNALVLDGEDDLVEVAPFDIEGEGLTISAWIQCDDFGTPDARIVSKATSPQEEDHYWMLSTFRAEGELRLRFRLKINGITRLLIADSGTLIAGEWTHVAATWDGSFMLIYENGKEVGRVSGSGTMDANPSVGVGIGNQPSGAGSRPFDGLIDDLRIYNRALTAEELADLIRQSETNEPPSISDIPDYVLDEDTSLGPIEFMVSDRETAPEELILQIASDNPSLIPPENITLNEPGANRSMTLLPASNQSGVANITVTVSDGSNESSVSFQIVVNAVNDPPILAMGAPFQVAANAGGWLKGLEISDVDGADGVFGITMEVEQGSLAMAPDIPGGLESVNIALNNTSTISFEGALAKINQTLAHSLGLFYRPRPKFAGQDTLTITVNDNGNTGAGGPRSAIFVNTISVVGSAQDHWRNTFFQIDALENFQLEKTVWGDLADPDHDGRGNLLEYAVGSDPTRGVDPEPGIVPEMVQVASEPHLSLAVNRRSNDPELQFIPEVSPDNQNWYSGEDYVEPVDSRTRNAEFNFVRYQDLTPVAPGKPRYMRLRVTRQSSPAEIVPDSDYDGRNDAQETLEGTDPNDADSYEFTRLGYWQFDDHYFVDAAGEATLEAENIQAAPGIEGNGIYFPSDQNESILIYPDVGLDSAEKINLRLGSFRFWFKPDWDSGTGPGHRGVLLELGEYDSDQGWWSLFVNAEGTQLTFSSHSDRNHGSSITRDIDWKAGEWREIVVAYNQSVMILEVDHQRLGGTLSTPGAVYYPGSEVRVRGFSLGSARDGSQAAGGAIDELETFNYAALTELDQYSEEATLSATGTSVPPTITLQWRNTPANPMNLLRRAEGESEWTTLETDYTGMSYVQSFPEVTAGRRYEYIIRPNPPSISGTLFDRYLAVEIDKPPMHDRGYVILLVDQTLSEELDLALEQFQRDLVGDGYRVIQHEVPRHDDNAWANNPPNIAFIKSLIDEDFQEHGLDIASIFIIGHAAIPYSGLIGVDGHGSRNWPCDLYYGDVIDGELWTDDQDTQINPDLKLIPGDGIFDQDKFPSDLEIPVGRIDFFNLPTFSVNPPAGAAPLSEAELLIRYLNKNQRYRHKELTYPERTAAFGSFTENGNRLTYFNGLKNTSAWFGLDPGRINKRSFFKQRDSYLWGFQLGAGRYDAIAVGNAVHFHSTPDLADPAREPAIGFYVLDGSYFGEWPSRDNFLRATLALPDSGLVALWGRFHKMWLQPMGLGEPVGRPLIRAINSIDDTRDGVLWYYENIFISILGDPTLRMQILKPPARPSAESGNSGVILKWDRSLDEEVNYFIYRSSNGLEGPFVLLNERAIPNSVFTDDSPPAGPKIYQVKAARKIVTGSGSFTNLSQAAFVNVD